MSDYTRVYDGAAKDTAESVLAGADFDSEFDLIQTAVNSKADKVTSATDHNLLMMNASGNLEDSGISTDGAGVVTLATPVITDPVVNIGSDSGEGIVLLPSGSWTAHAPGLVNNTWYTIASTAIPNGAKYAIIKAEAVGTINNALSSNCQIQARPVGGGGIYLTTGITVNIAESYELTSAAATHIHTLTAGLAFVELDASGDFDVRGRGFTTSLTTLNVYVIGYTKELS